VSDEPMVRRSVDRFTSHGEGTLTRHLLSFGAHYDADRIAIGPLVAFNDETVAPGAGFDDHVHRDVEIITWVVEGRLQHRDSTGTSGTITPGTAQRLWAGAGVTHAELNADDDPADGQPVRFIQMWLRPNPTDDTDRTPSYAERPLEPAALDRGLVVVASGDSRPGATGVSLSQPGATLYASRLAPTAHRELPAAAVTLMFVITGQVALAGSADDASAGDVTLDAGDSITLTARPEERSTPTVRANLHSEILVWTFA
jgi:redox-sensitive bicupin YhaK (pirin superfamily)